MARSKKFSKSSTDCSKAQSATSMRSYARPLAAENHVPFPRSSCADHFCLVEPQINAEGIHVWPFDVACPMDVVFLMENGQQKVRMNRHPYFEVLYLCSGSAVCHIQDRFIPMRVGDLVVIGSTLYHRIECRSSAPLTIAALFFEPDMIRCDGGSDSMEYLTPFLLQDSTFPHIIPAESGVPRQVLDMMMRIHAERASVPKTRLSLKTYLKMILALLVNHYSSYAGTVEVFYRQERALDRIRPLFRFLEQNCGSSIQIRQAARVCGMSESHFMSVFKEVSGLSFLKYLNQYRIERAQAMLTHTEESMKNICQDVGFCDQSYFGAVFRKIVGVTPAEYRRRFRNGAVPNLPYMHQDAGFKRERFPGRLSEGAPGNYGEESGGNDKAPTLETPRRFASRLATMREAS